MTCGLAFFVGAFVVIGHVQRSVGAVLGVTCSRCRRGHVAVSMAGHTVVAFKYVRYGKRSEILVLGHPCGVCKRVSRVVRAMIIRQIR